MDDGNSDSLLTTMPVSIPVAEILCERKGMKKKNYINNNNKTFGLRHRSKMMFTLLFSTCLVSIYSFSPGKYAE